MLGYFFVLKTIKLYPAKGRKFFLISAAHPFLPYNSFPQQDLCKGSNEFQNMFQLNQNIFYNFKFLILVWLPNINVQSVSK